MLETFRTETMTNARKRFVEDLASDNKILASQIDKLTVYALSLDDAGYDAWSATYEDAPSLPMLESQNAGVTNADGSGSHAESVVAQEIKTNKEIIQHHKRTRMTDDQIKQTPSYQRLMELDPTYKL